MQNAYAFKSYFLQCEGDNLSVAKPGFPPRAPPIWATPLLPSLTETKFIPLHFRFIQYFFYTYRLNKKRLPERVGVQGKGQRASQL